MIEERVIWIEVTRGTWIGASYKIEPELNRQVGLKMFHQE